MKRLASFASAILVSSVPVAFAQGGEPTYKGDPDVYKIIFEDQNLRVISAIWPAGATDKPHTHPVPSIIYFLTDCTQTLTSADGKTREAKPKAGVVNSVPIVAEPHTARNTGPECRAIIVEKK
jgi:hypothetical protein